MFTDLNLKVATGQVVTASANSTDVIDLLQARAIGEGQSIYMVLTVTVSAGGTGNYEFIIRTASDAALSANVRDYGRSEIYAVADLTAGRDQIVVRGSPLIAYAGGQYLGCRYLVSGGSPTNTAFNVEFAIDPGDGKKFYPSGFTL